MTDTQEAPAPNRTSPEIPTPSVAGLVRATVVAAIIATVLLVLVVLPAEYDIDPTGVGGALGLTRLSAPADDGLVVAAAAAESSAPGERGDSTVVEVPAGRGVEYKFRMQAGGKMKFKWTSDAGSLFFDFHGEPTGDTTGFFESYAVTTASETEGTFTAPFDGSHGWYWKNSGTTPVRVSLTTSGAYDVLGLR